MIPGIYIRLAVLAACLLCAGLVARWIWKDGYNTAEQAWIKKAQESEIRALKAEAERDEAGRRVAEEAAKNLSRQLAQVEIQSQVTIARIIPLLPDVDPQCVLPDGVRDEIESAIERADSASGEPL